MKRFITITFSCIVSLCYAQGDRLASSAQSSQSKVRIPVIYSTDLYHPPQDPDDHYDLALLACIEELDVKALIFDVATSFRKPEEFGKTALEQMAAITGEAMPPWKVGLRDSLRSPDDKALDQPEEYQGGVALILSTLEQSEEPVVMFLVGSCRDFAVAFNRDPDLLRKKVKAVYVNAGNGPGGIQKEWNVKLDPNAYFSLMNSGLPIYWCPCFTDYERLCTPEEVVAGNGFCTYFKVANQAELLADARAMVKNYFVYALNRLQDEPVGFLYGESRALPEGGRNMWCTGPFLHAAGRTIQRTPDNQWIAVPSDMITTTGLAVEVFRFEQVKVTSVWKDENGKRLPEFRDGGGTSLNVFRYVHPEFNEIMSLVLKGLLERL